MLGRPGEREIIRILTGIYGKQGRLPLDFDDDVAAIPQTKDRWIILKSDMLVASTDIPPGMSLQQAARKAVVATVSDFAAKGVRPRALMVSLGLPKSLGKRGITEIGIGLDRAAREYTVQIVGGDTNESNDLVIDCIGAGEADPSVLMRRDGARPGDVVAVTGQFGNPAAGLRLLLSKRKISSVEDRSLARAVLLPRARLREGLALAKTGMVTSSIDSSDGLAWSLHELGRSSRVGIHLDSVPLAMEARRFGEKNMVSPLELALYGGEEYELVVTIRKEGFGMAKRKVRGLIPIGWVQKGHPIVTAGIGGRTVEVEARGWEHFRRAIASPRRLWSREF